MPATANQISDKDKVGKVQNSPSTAKRQLLKLRFETLLKKTKGLELSDPSVKRSVMTPATSDGVDHGITAPGSSKKGKGRRLLVLGLSSAVIVPLLLGFLSVVLEVEITSSIARLIREEPCAVENNAIVMEISRPITNCELCSNLYTVPVERNLTKMDFIEKYAYSGVPVLVKGATTTWTAMTQFSFGFFKDLYQSKYSSLEDLGDECQFFPYKTEFSTLKEVFEMDDDRANLKPGHPNWYIGWSNCHEDTGSVLRQHYTKPYFLPDDSESSTIDWLFMGGSGEGANLHLDYVQRPSWQAQISGRKSWTLVPCPECEGVCHNLNVTVDKGDIFVVDTNTWYHSTFVHPGEISITIGSEYD